MQAFTYQYKPAKSKTLRDIVVIYWATDQFNLNLFSDTIDANIANDMVPEEVIVLLREPLFENAKQQLENSKTTTIRSRLGPDVPFQIIGYDQEGRLAKRYILNPSAISSHFCIDEFKRRAVTNIFRQRQGFIKGNNRYHFQNPSKRHSQKFLRLANILANAAEISFIAFCLLKFISKKARFAYIDTPALHVLVAAVQEQLRSFEHDRILYPINFSSYASIETYDFRYSRDSIVLISASTTGSLAKEIAQKTTIKHEQICHVLYLGINSKQFQAACNLQKEAENPDGYPITEAVSADNCEACKKHSIPIPLVGDQFNFAGPQVKPILIRTDHAPKELKAALSYLVGYNVLGIGADCSNNDGREHFFYFDTEKLLATPRFVAKLNYLVMRNFPAQARHIIYDNDISKTVAQHIRNGLDKTETIKLVSKQEIGEIPENENSPLVVVTSAIETGRTLQDISRRLRKLAKDVPIIYLAGISKSTGDHSRESLKSNLIFSEGPVKHIYEHILQTVLPDSSFDNAWLAERQLLLEILHNDNFSDTKIKAIIESRINRLNRTSEPLVDDLFLPNQSNKKLELRPGFAFWKDLQYNCYSQADVFFTISSVLQNLRTAGLNSNSQFSDTEAIHSNWLQQTVLAPENFDRFNDGIIQASFLRAAHPRELNYTTLESESSQMLKIIVPLLESTATDPSGAGVEFLISLATGRLRLSAKSNTTLSEIDKKILSPKAELLLDHYLDKLSTNSTSQ
jgi:hypothetical protein